MSAEFPTPAERLIDEISAEFKRWLTEKSLRLAKKSESDQIFTVHVEHAARLILAQREFSEHLKDVAYQL